MGQLKFEPSVGAKDVQKEMKETLEEKKNKQRYESEALVKAVWEAFFKAREEDLRPYREKCQERQDNISRARLKEREELWELLEKLVRDTLLNPDARSYAAWRAGIANMAAAATALNKALFSYNLNLNLYTKLQGVRFHFSQKSDTAKSIRLKVDKAINRFKEFFDYTGTLPKNFDPQFSMYAKMENGRAYGKLYSGEQAEEVLFTKSDSELSLPDPFLAGYLKEKTDYELIQDMESPLFRRVVRKEDNLGELFEFLSDHPDAAKQIQLSPSDRTDIPANYLNYHIRATEFKVDPIDPYECTIVAEESYIDSNDNQVKKRELTIPFAFGIDLDNSIIPHYFIGESEAIDREIAIQYKLPAKQLTTQDELDNIIDQDEFIDYCQRKINEKVTDFHVNVKMVTIEHGVPNIECYQVINGVETQINLAPELRIQIEKEFEGMVESKEDLKLNQSGKVIFSNKYKTPENGKIKKEIKNFLNELNIAGEFNDDDIDLDKNKVYLIDASNQRIPIDMTLSQLAEDEDQLKITFSGVPLNDEECIIQKKHRVMNEAELNTEFAPRLQLALEDEIKLTIDDINNKPLQLMAYNPDAATSSPRP